MSPPSPALVVAQLYERDVVGPGELARVTGTSQRTVARWRAGDAAPREQAERRLREVRTIVDLASRVMPDDAIRYWLRSPNPDLGYEKPLDLIAEGSHQRVTDLLLGLAEGVTT